MVSTILLIIAIICFLLATIGVASRVNLVPLGLAFLTGALLVNNFVLT